MNNLILLVPAEDQDNHGEGDINKESELSGDNTKQDYEEPRSTSNLQDVNTDGSMGNSYQTRVLQEGGRVQGCVQLQGSVHEEFPQV